MTKEEAVKQYNDGLETSMNHPILLENRKLKDLMKLLCVDAFELGWDVCMIETKQVTEEEIEIMSQKMKERIAKIYQ